MNEQYRRREVLSIAGSSGFVVLAGCSGGSPDPTSTPTEPGGGTTSFPADDESTASQTDSSTASNAGSLWEFPARAVSRNWSMPRHDAGHTNYNPVSAGPTSPPTVLWEAEPIPESSLRSRIGTILVQDGVVYVMDQEECAGGVGGCGTSASVAISAVNENNGSKLWDYQLGPDTGARVLGVDENAVYLGQFTDNEPLYFEAVSLQDGSNMWSRTLDSVTYRDFTWYPLLHNGYIIADGQGQQYSDKVVALNAESGETEWEIDSASNSNQRRLAAAGEKLIETGGASDVVYRIIDINSGSVINTVESANYSIAPASGAESSPAIGPEKILLRHLGRPSSLWGIRLVGPDQVPSEGVPLEEGKIVGNYGVNRRAKLALTETTLNIAERNRASGNDKCFSYDYNGNLLWQSEAPAKSIVVDQNSIYVEGVDAQTHTVTSLDRDSGDTRWEYDIQEVPTDATDIVPAHNRVYLSHDEKLIALG